MRVKWKQPLVKGLILSRPNRFVMNVELFENKQIFRAHCPVTGHIGWLDLTQHEERPVECLLSMSSSSKRTTAGTVEAIRVDEEWRGINQGGANTIIEQFIRANALETVFGHRNGETVKREKQLGDSRIDLVLENNEGGRDFVEIKSPIGGRGKSASGRRVPEEERSRLVKHLQDLSKELRKEGTKSRAFVLLSFQWQADRFRPPQVAENIPSVIRDVVKVARECGVQFYQINTMLSQDDAILGNVMRLEELGT
jgi:DNA-binding sugar fermentation-stimulating protein